MIQAILSENHTRPGKVEVSIIEQTPEGEYIRTLGNAYYPYVNIISTNGAEVSYKYLIFGKSSKNGKIQGDFNVDSILDCRSN